MSGAPARLPWGGGGNVAKRITTMKAPPSRKRERSSNERSNQMWTERYKPTNVKDLCVAPKRVKQISEWLEDPTKGNLMILIGSPGIGKSTTVDVLCNGRVHEWVEGSTSESTPIQSFSNFLEQTRFLGPTKVILVDELPFLYNEESQKIFREAWGNHVVSTRHKTVWVYSNTEGGQHRPKELERYIDPSILYNPNQVTIMQIHSVTNARMKKAIQPICKEFRIRSPPDLSIFNGDLRHAIMSLQFSISSTSSLRDTSLSSFHALGKLLYAKREKEGNVQKDGRLPLEFIPEDVLNRSSLPNYVSLSFLHGHAPDFFTDIEDLDQAFGHYSDASVLMGNQLTHSAAESLLSRTAANSNHHPAPSKFRSFTSPAIFEVNRKARDNRSEMELSFPATINSLGNFVSDYLPYIRRIPNTNRLPQLYSHAGSSHGDYKNKKDNTPSPDEKWKMEEQAAILALDDIVDDDDDSSVEELHSIKKKSFSQQKHLPGSSCGASFEIQFSGKSV